MDHSQVGSSVPQGPSQRQQLAESIGKSMRRDSLWWNAGFVLAALMLWQVLGAQGSANAPVWPTPGAVLRRTMTDLVTSNPLPGDLNSGRSLAVHAWITLSRWAAGFALALLIGVPVGICLGLSRTAHAVGEPWVQLLRALPSAAIYPLAIVALRLGWGSQLATIVYGALWPVVMGTTGALRRLPLEFLDTLEFLHLEWWRLIRAAVRRALPEIFVGIEISAGVAFLLAVTVEIFYEADGGLGAYLSLKRSGAGQEAAILGCIGLAAWLGWALNHSVSSARRRLAPWSVVGEEGDTSNAAVGRSRTGLRRAAVEGRIGDAKRRILTADYVTGAIEAIYQTPVRMAVHFQDSPPYMLPERVQSAFGRGEGGQSLVQRDITLSCGVGEGAAGVPVLFARSWILTRRLPERVVVALQRQEETIGKILHNERVVYRNQDLGYERIVTERLASIFHECGAIECVIRWRALEVDGQIAIVIQEVIPSDVEPATTT